MSSPSSTTFGPSVPAKGYIALAGPTASGKTMVAMDIARHLPLEIISVDSALVYRGMDIGTAKPSPSERAEVAHHLIDIRDPSQAYSAAQFVQDARRLIVEIRSRGNWPLLVGGTMLYFKALRQGLDAMPSADPAIRLAIAAEASDQGWAQMHQQLGLVDPVSAARLAPNDSQRIGRALEVYRVSGRPLSDFQSGKASDQHPPIVMLSLEPQNRAWLHERITRRLDTMLAQGFIEEVKALRARADLHADLPAMRCVGYRQAWSMLEGDYSMTEFRERAVFATRQLAKRQITWLRSISDRDIIASDQPEVSARTLARLRQVLKA